MGEVKEKPTDLRKTNLAVNPTSTTGVFEQSQWRAAGARSGDLASSFSQPVLQRRESSLGMEGVPYRK